MKIEKSRRVVESRPVCMDLKTRILQTITTFKRIRRERESKQWLTLIFSRNFKIVVSFSFQSRLNIKKKFPRSGKYVVLVQYFTTYPNTQFLDLYVTAREQSFVRFRLPSCKYTFGCRTVGLTINGAVGTIDLKADVEYRLTAVTSQRGDIAVVSYIQSRHLGITAAGGGGGELVLPDQTGLAEDVPDGHFSR